MPTDAPPRVLLADDDFEMRALVTAALRTDGYDVTEVSDGGQLLTRIASTYLPPRSNKGFYDLVISDIRMPVYSGLMILEGLRAARWSNPVILMTAFGDKSIRSRVEELGALLFDKPFDLDDLRTAVLNVAPITWPRANQIVKQDAPEDDQDRRRAATLTIAATFANTAQALLAKERLEGAGVDAYVAGEITARGKPYLSLAAGGVALYVPDADVQRARELLTPMMTKGRAS